MPKGITDRQELFERAVAEVIERPALEALLASGERLRIKQGFDPTRPNLHLGHAVGLRKLRAFAQMGHEVTVIIGDYTAQIGDPSEREDSRAAMSHDDVLRNAETYLAQFHRIVPRQNVRVVYQTEWYGTFSLKDTIQLASRFTTQQMLARQELRDRMAAKVPIPIKDLLYPLLQAYDSVAIRADVEFGGTEQKFNILLGRELQQQVGQRPQQVFLVPLLPGLDGEKMSKTKPATAIWLTDPPDEVFGKLMSLRDELMPAYFEWATELPWDEARRHVAALRDGSLHPREAKEILARRIVTDLHSQDAAEQAAAAFARQFRQREAPAQMPTVRVEGGAIVDALVAAKLASSRGDARRLIEQGGVRVDGQVVTDLGYLLPADGARIVQVGRRRFARVERAR